MNRTVLSAQFHSDVFVASINISSTLSAGVNSSRWRDLSMKCDAVGVYVYLIPAGKPTGEEVFVPWSNVKVVRLAAEDKPASLNVRPFKTSS